MKFRKKPVVIEAVRWTGKNLDVMHEFLNAHTLRYDGGFNLSIKTLEGTMMATPGDWIIKGVKGEFYPCKPDIFEASYEPSE